MVDGSNPVKGYNPPRWKLTLYHKNQILRVLVCGKGGAGEMVILDCGFAFLERKWLPNAWMTGNGTQGKKILIVSLPQSGYRHMSIFFLSAYAARHLRSKLFR